MYNLPDLEVDQYDTVKDSSLLQIHHLDKKNHRHSAIQKNPPTWS